MPFGHERRAVGVVARRRVVAAAEHRGMERERPVERAHVRIDQQLRRIEAMAFARRRTGRARAARSARRRRRRRRSRGTRRRCAAGKRDALELASRRRVEEAKLDRARRARRRPRRWRRPRASVTPSGSGLPGPRACVRPRGARRARDRARVAFRGPRPADVGRHRAELHAPPQRAIAPQRDGASDRELQMAARDRRELDAGAGARRQRHLVRVDDVSARPPTRATIGIAP